MPFLRARVDRRYRRLGVLAVTAFAVTLAVTTTSSQVPATGVPEDLSKIPTQSAGAGYVGPDGLFTGMKGMIESAGGVLDPPGLTPEGALDFFNWCENGDGTMTFTSKYASTITGKLDNGRVVIVDKKAGTVPKRPAPTKPKPAPKASITIKPDNGGPPDSVVKSQSFTVEAFVPQGQPTPDTISVHIDNADKYLNGSANVTLKKGTATSAGTVYQSAPITIEGKAYWFDWVTVKNGGTLTASGTIGNQPVSTTFTVYDTFVKQAVGRNEALLNQAKTFMTKTVAAADGMLPVIDARIKAATDPALRLKLEADRKTVIDAKALAQQKLQIIDTYFSMANWGQTHDTGPLYAYTDQYKFQLGKQMIPLVLTSTPFDVRNALDTAASVAQNNARNEIQEIQFEATKLLAIGLYQATAELTLAGPAWTLLSPVGNRLLDKDAVDGGGTWQGTTIYGTAATSDDYLHAGASLLMAFAMMKGVPVACDALGEAIAPGFKGRAPMFDLPTGPVGETGRGGGVIEGGRGAGGAPVRFAEAQVRVTDAQVQQGMADLVKAGDAAKAAGADPATVDQALNGIMQDMQAQPNSVMQMKAVAEGHFDLTQIRLRVTNPNAVEITDMNVAQLVRSVRIKAAVEMKPPQFDAAGNQLPRIEQVWTPEEASMLHDLATNPVYQNAYLVDDPFVTGSQPGADFDPFGYEAALTPADVYNIGQAAKLPIKIDLPELPPTRPAVGRGAPPVINQPGPAANPTALPPGIRAPWRPGATQILRPGENPYIIDRPGINQVTGAPNGQPGVEIKGALDFKSLVTEIGNKQAKLSADTQRFNASPIREEPGKFGVSDFQALRPEGVKQFTPGELDRLTPTDIGRLPSRFLAELPVNKLNPGQQIALAKALGVPLPEMPPAPNAVFQDLNTFGLSTGILLNHEIPPALNLRSSFSDPNFGITLPGSPGSDFTPGFYMCPPNHGSATPSMPYDFGFAQPISFGNAFIPLDALAFDNGPGDGAAQLLDVIMKVANIPVYGSDKAPEVDWLSPARLPRALPAYFDLRPEPPLGGSQRVTPAGPPEAGKLRAVFVSLGTVTGDAFDVSVFNETGAPVSLIGDGIVVESVARANQDRDRRRIQDDIRAHKSQAPTPVRVTGYCLEYRKSPPAAGALYRVASPAVQQKYAALHHILRVEEEMEQGGTFTPDIERNEYFHQLRQWALWSREQGFTKETFATEFVDHARRNMVAARQPWTKQVEAQVASLVPHRWQEIAAILEKAAGPGRR